MFRPLNKGIGTASEAVSGKGGTDALLKALHDASLDEWTALRLLYENTNPGVQGYICNRIPELGEATVERYLLQLVYLAVHRPGGQLERILLTLCKHSFRVAIKAQWLFVAMCQDHPKNKALESVREQAYKAALEGKWEVPIRTARLDPLSPHTSQHLSPPVCSPSSSYLAAYIGQGNQLCGEDLASQPYRLQNAGFAEESVATQPPGSMVMSPPGIAGLSSTFRPFCADASAPAALQQRRSGALGCLLPVEQHPEPGLPAPAGMATVVTPPLQPKAGGECAGGKASWLDNDEVTAFAPAIKTSAARATSANGGSPTADAALGPVAEGCIITPSVPAKAMDLVAATAAAGASEAAAHITAVAGCPTDKQVVPPSTHGPNLVTASIAERIQALKRELGDGEGVSALLERAKQQGMAPVAAIEDDAILSDDELSNRPMSPLTRLRFDTFGATLDFVETLCDASSSLTSYSQGERQNALRESLEIINHEIERANRREVAIWFPMGRRGDRVLRLSAREAVLLNSREKAPFMLFVEVLEGQNECGDSGNDTDAFAGLSIAADVKAHVDSLGGLGLSVSMMMPSTSPKLEFGRRETYGIALTGIGAQHQLHYMHALPSFPVPGSKTTAEGGKHHGGAHQRNHQISNVAGGLGRRRSHDRTSIPVSRPEGQPDESSQGRSDVLVSPTPTRAGSGSQAALLEEQAAALALAVVSRPDHGAGAAPANGGAEGRGSTSGSGLGPIAAATGSPPAPVLQAATEVVIPTRSASSSNIAAAAAAAALAASASGGAAESILLASARSSEAGVPGSGGGVQPLTPRSCGSLSGFPPRPPAAAATQQQHQQLQSIGSISPVNAAKEVSAGQDGGILSASSLLRRVFGDRAEAASSSGEDQGAPGSAGMTRALDGKFGTLEAPRIGTIASAAAASFAPSSLSASIAQTGLLKPLQPAPYAMRSSGIGLGLPSDGKQHDPMLTGLFGPNGCAKCGPEMMMSKLSDISASLRGEMPMVRVKILPLDASGAADAASALVGCSNYGGAAAVGGCNSSGGLHGATAFSLASLGSRAKAALLNQQPQALPAAPEDATEGGQSKTALLLSRLGWCRKPVAEDTTGDAGTCASTTGAAPTATSSSAQLDAGASQVTIPVTSGGGLLMARRLPGMHGSEPQLVRLVLTVATQGVNLDIKSPYRKSRRMPSHEAIEMMAGKFKIHQLPPPPECGPPLGPVSFGSMVGMGQVLEGVGDEGESGAQSTTATPPGVQESTATVILSTAEAGPYTWECGRGVASRTADSVRPAAALQPSVAGNKMIVLGPPLPPEWECRDAATAAQQQQQQLFQVVHTPGLPHNLVAVGRCGGKASEVPSSSSTTSSQPTYLTDWWKSGPAAVAEAAATLEVAGKSQLNAVLPVMGDAGSGPGATLRPPGLKEKSAPASDKTIEAGGSAVPTSLPPSSGASSGLAASLQSSLTRILNRSHAGAQPQSQTLTASSSAASVTLNTAADSDGGGQANGAVEAVSGNGSALLERQLVSTGLSEGLGLETAKPSASNVACSDAGAKTLPQPQRTGGPQPEAGFATPSAPAGSGLAASLQFSLTRILNRAASGQQSPFVEGAHSAGSGSSTGSGANAAGPRGVSPVRGNGVGGGAGGGAGGAGGSSTYQPQGVARTLGLAAATTMPELAAAEGEVKGAAASHVQQRISTGTSGPEGSHGASGPVGGGLAASLQSSITRILNRSGPGQQQQQQQPLAEAAGPASSNTGGNVPGLSPRGGSPVRSNMSSGSGGTQPHSVGDVAAPPGGASTGIQRFSKLLGRMQHDQQAPSVAPNQHATPGQSQPQLPQQQKQQQQHVQVHGRLTGMQHVRRAPPPVLVPESPMAAGGPAPPLPHPQRSLPYSLPKVTDGRYERESLEEARRREAQAVYGERWAAKVKRIQRESPHGRRQGWALRCVIVKSGDDCRQELLALQLVRTFGDIFAEAGLPLWVRFYEVLVTSNRTALIEMVPNTLSIHTIKSRSPPGTSLSDHFFAKFGKSGSPECTAAQRRFTESLAAYSLICYLLQIKDRHNGNILIDDNGRVVHIDYGFLLSNSPGGVNFESAPFKLTRELLEVMDSNSDGRPSEMFDYFKVLMIQGFIAVRSYSDRIMLLVKIMSKSGFPCFKSGERALKALEKRLMNSLTEVQCVEHVLQLIAESLDAWRTRQYDYYQRVLNGIL